MKKFVSLCVMFALLFCAVQASARILETKKHGSWRSFIVDSEGYQFAGMSCLHKEVSLVVCFYPKQLTSPKHYMILLMSPLDGYNKPHRKNLRVPGQMRVDRMRLYDIDCSFEADKNDLFCYLNGDLAPDFFLEAMKGSTVRIKVNFEEPVILKFPLSGFTAAMDRCAYLLERLEAEGEAGTNPDEQYFRERRRQPRPRPDSRRDLEYF